MSWPAHSSLCPRVPQTGTDRIGTPFSHFMPLLLTGLDLHFARVYFYMGMIENPKYINTFSQKKHLLISVLKKGSGPCYSEKALEKSQNKSLRGFTQVHVLSKDTVLNQTKIFVTFRYIFSFCPYTVLVNQYS